MPSETKYDFSNIGINRSLMKGITKLVLIYFDYAYCIYINI